MYTHVHTYKRREIERERHELPLPHHRPADFGFQVANQFASNLVKIPMGNSERGK